MSEGTPGVLYDKYDYKHQEHQHEMERLKLQEAEQTKRAKYQLRKARQQTYQVVGIGALIAAVILTIIICIYLYNVGDNGPIKDGLSEEERRENACIASGGGWVPEDLLANADSGICVHTGKEPTQ